MGLQGSHFGPGGIDHGREKLLFPDVFARTYSLTGDKSWLEWAKAAWSWGSKRGFETKSQAAAEDEIYVYANHRAPKDDSALATARMFYEFSRAK